ncbi:hypothetical protein SteCoe_16564 [Stentor coeruleus]|uniref:Uncharacterized protein n=1 Tax=Stentor coeruleus TaxID=5963 RepID=A0A1R2C0V7_9CILI|nr:hypothetical protein SteCoe_16564 [Stentor coeruleus]
MGNNSSKVPTPHQGQALKLIGLKEYDDFYKSYESHVKRIDYIRTEVDLRFTDFIKSLGATKLWERCSKFQEMMKMMIIVLATNGKGDINSILWTEEPPYIQFVSHKYSKQIKRLIEDFSQYVFRVHDYQKELLEIQDNFYKQELNKRLDDINEKAADDVIEKEYSTEDMIRCMEIVDQNYREIMKAVDSVDKLIDLDETVKSEIFEVFKESKAQPRVDRIIQQVAQAMFQGLSSPEMIVRYFWPYPNI